MIQNFVNTQVSTATQHTTISGVGHQHVLEKQLLNHVLKFWRANTTHLLQNVSKVPFENI